MIAAALQGPADFREAHHAFGAMCGHGALAAALEKVGVVWVCLILFNDDLKAGRQWVNMPMMERALDSARRCPMFKGDKLRWRIVGREWPKRGLTMLQWEGPWTQPGVPARVACMHRHWVAVRDGLVWDINTEAWMPREEWEGIVSDLLPAKATGWSVARGYEIEKGGVA